MLSILYTNTSGVLSGLSIDAALSRTHTKTVEVTKYPVEDGTVISDHAILRPDTYQLDGLVSNTPPVSELVLSVMAPRRAETARDLLESIIESRLPVTIRTEVKDYPMMVLSNLSFPTDPTTGDATRFSCSAEQIVKVKSETVAIPNSGKAGATHGGRQPTQKAPEPVKKKVSVLKSLVDWARGK